MKEIVEFLKQQRNLKYSLGTIVFGLIFTFSFQANRAQILQILEKPVRIVPGTEEARQYQVSGWQGAYAKDKESVFKVVLSEKKTYRLSVKAFSCSPPDALDQSIEVHFNDVALDRLKFRKTSEWQKFSVNIPSSLLQETSIVKFIYSQDISLFPIVFSYLEFKNCIFRIKGFYLLFDSRRQGWTNYLTPHPAGYFFGSVLLFWLFWLFYSRFLSFAFKIELFRAARIDFLSYLPSIILLSLFALVSFFSPYRFIYSRKTFFILAIAPTIALKLPPYKDLFLRFTKIAFKFILYDIEKTCSEVKKVYSACLPFFSFLKKQIITFRRFLVRYHKINRSSAFIFDFMILLVLCIFLFMIKESITTWIANRIVSLAYCLLVVGIIMKIIQLTQEQKTGDGKSFIRIKKIGKVPFPRLILRIKKIGKVPFPRLILRIKKIGKVPFKKIILRLVSILLVSLFLWLILPGKGVEVTQLIPRETFIFFSLKIDPEVPGTSDLINNLDWRIRWGARLLGPVEVVAFTTPAVSKKEPDYLFLVKNKRLIRIARLFRRSIDKAMISEKPFKKSKYKTCQILHVARPRHPNNVCSYTLFRDIALFSNNPSLLKASLDQAGRETSFISGEALSDFRELQSSGEALFFANNSRFEVSRALESLGEKSAYAILSAVSSLNYLGGYFNILDADSLKGSLRFKYREKVDIKKGQGDIYFLVGLAKRLWRANGLKLEVETIIDKNYLHLNFTLSGLKAAINNFLAEEMK